MTVLGLGGAGRDLACAIVAGGELRGAVELAKLGPGATLVQMIEACASAAGLAISAIERVGMTRPVSEEDLRTVRALLPGARVSLFEHHLAHAAAAFYPSPFEKATVLTLDSGGTLKSGQLAAATAGGIVPSEQWLWPDSVAGLYSAVTRLLGFRARAEEHKVQWMSVDGDDRYVPLFETVLGSLGDQGGTMDGSYFRRDGAGLEFSSKFWAAIDLRPSDPVPAPLRAHVAAGVQRAVERTVVRMSGSGDNLCLGGGLFFNVLLVRAIEESGRWKNVFVQPAAGNSGSAIGAAYLAGDGERRPLTSLGLGAAYKSEQIKQVIENCKVRFRLLLTEDDLVNAALDHLTASKIVAWMQGRTEFGPRALGNRSILASPLDPYASENLNTFIKHREAFRKFAASVPAEVAADYFDVSANARFLATVGRVQPEHRAKLGAALLGDGLVRVHVVQREENPLFHRLLTDFGQRTGLPILYNTSFNLFGDPLVSSPRDAVRSFFSSGIDSLFCGYFCLEK